LQQACTGTSLNAPDLTGSREERNFTLDSDSGAGAGRGPFDSAVSQLSDALNHAVRDCVDSDDEGARRGTWLLPWSSEEVSYFAEGDEDKDASEVRREVGVEYRRGCWQGRKHAPMHAHAAHHSLCGPDVEARLPEIWRELADKLWVGILSLVWGADVPVQAVITVEATCGRRARPPGAQLPSGCSSASPGAWVVITSVTEDELEQVRTAVAPVLQRVLSEMRVNGLFAQSSLCMPQYKQPNFRRAGVGGGGSSSSGSDAGSDEESEEVMSDAEPSESYRPLRLTRAQVRDAYLQGLLCLNCDAADHKHQDCAFRKKVCWNCHGNHAGNVCPLRCRFCRERHDYPLLECVKRVCRRVNDWKKSTQAQEQRTVISIFEQLMIKLEGFEDFSLAKHNVEVQQLVKGLAEKNSLFPGELNELARSILNMQPPPKKQVEQAVPPPPPGPPPKPYVAPKMPKEPPPPMPENKYPWQDKVFLDTLLAKGMYGSNVLSRVIGRGGMHHRRMETESGARVFFRGLGVSGRDMELNEPSDCRLHISVKGDVPAQGQTVRRIVKEIISELDNEIEEKCAAGPLLDKPRDVDAHPFGFLLARGSMASATEYDEPLKFRFPEEDGATLNDLLVWLKQAKLPLELDSDTQWRTTLQITPAEPAPPDDAPEEAEAVVLSFNRVLAEWQYPCPYWFEEQDLRPTGLWTSLTADDDNEGAEDAPQVLLQQGQGVRLSASAVAHFAALLDQSRLGGVSRATAIDVLARLRGVVRRQAADEQLLLYLSYPWAFFAEAMGRGLKLPFNREQVHSMLVELGRVGAKPTEACAAPPFRGFIVEWMPLKGAPRDGTERPPASAETPSIPALPAPTAPAGTAEWAPPTPQPPAPQPPAPAAEAPAMPTPTTPAPAGASAPPRGVCKYWLPELVFSSTQDLRELLAGPGGAHFTHLLKKFPSVELHIDGQSSRAAPPAHRLHVCMSSGDSEAFEGAAADVLDLVETVCDMVGEELGMNEEQVEGLIREVRAEKYFEAHGIRTPLAPSRAAAPPPPGSTAAEAAAGAAPGAARAPEAATSGASSTAPAALAETPAPTVPAAPPAAPKPDVDFEFVDDDVEMAEPAAAADGDATEDEDDARTEASDLVSEISDEGAPAQAPQLTFDDI